MCCQCRLAFCAAILGVGADGLGSGEIPSPDVGQIVGAKGLGSVHLGQKLAGVGIG